MYAIQASNLTKKYEQVVALSGLDLTVEPGSVMGYLGPNVPRYEQKTLPII